MAGGPDVRREGCIGRKASSWRPSTKRGCARDCGRPPCIRCQVQHVNPWSLNAPHQLCAQAVCRSRHATPALPCDEQAAGARRVAWTAARTSDRSRSRAWSAPARCASRSVRPHASAGPKMAWCCTPKPVVSVAAIASTSAPARHRRRRGPVCCAQGVLQSGAPAAYHRRRQRQRPSAPGPASTSLSPASRGRLRSLPFVERQEVDHRSRLDVVHVVAWRAQRVAGWEHDRATCPGLRHRPKQERLSEYAGQPLQARCRRENPASLLSALKTASRLRPAQPYCRKVSVIAPRLPSTVAPSCGSKRPGD